MFEVQQALSFIPPTTSENDLSHLIEAHYSWAPSFLVLLWLFCLDIEMLALQEHFYLHLLTLFYENQEEPSFSSLSRGGWSGGLLEATIPSTEG